MKKPVKKEETSPPAPVVAEPTPKKAEVSDHPFVYRKIKRGGSKYPIHVFRKNEMQLPICGRDYGIFEHEPSPIPTVDQMNKDVCWNCRWEMDNITQT